MCGISGIIHQNNTLKCEEALSKLKRMNEAIRHRGPDEDGFYQDEHCSLAMRRLSIIDLHTGQQPIFNEDKSLCIFFNGEIYNFQELRQLLIGKGHQFRTNSDTETILHLYEEEGKTTPCHLKGMFAFCIYNIPKQEWFFARDRFGEKPFYYYHKGAYFSFASEVNALLEDNKVPRILNQSMLPYYLANTMIPEPFTLLNDVRSLPPGHSAILRDGILDVEAYFSVNYKPDPSLKTEEDCKAYLKPILEKAVERQMISDVPLGAFLSGGIDSSTVVANMQKYSKKPVKTFTVRFEEASYDESPIAKEVSDFVGTEHHELTIPNADFSEKIFWSIVTHVGLPFPDSSAIPSYFITKEIQKHVTVALSGDGGDELFAGYPVYQQWQKIRTVQERLPKPLIQLASGMFRGLSHLPFASLQTKVRQIHKALDIASREQEQIGHLMHQLFRTSEVAALYKNAPELDFSLMAFFPPQSEQWTTLRKSMYYRLIHDLPLDMLTKVDRMSMANSLEVRAPFLDADLFDASTCIPDQFLIKDGNGKHIIRTLMSEDLPRSVFEHPKSGFSIPLHKYQNRTYEGLAEQLMQADHPLFQIFDYNTVTALRKETLLNKANNAKRSLYNSSHQIWSLMQLFAWVKYYKIDVE